MSVKKENSPIAQDVLSWELFRKGALKRKTNCLQLALWTTDLF